MGSQHGSQSSMPQGQEGSQILEHSQYKISDLIQDFVWDGGSSKISKTTLIQNIENGGLKMVDYKTKITALKCSWVKQMTNSSNANWKIFPKYFYDTKNLYAYLMLNRKRFQKISKDF